MSSLDELDIYIPHAVIEIVASLDEEIDQLRAEIERLRADAERLTKAHDHQHEMAGLMLREAERQSKENNLLRSNQREMLAQLRYIRMHLYAATVQRSPADDRIIADHIEQAYLRTNEVIMEMEKTGD